MSLVLLSLILAGCARWIPAPAKVRLPEPVPPACLVEEAPRGDEVVGRYKFAPDWLAALTAKVADGMTIDAAQDALQCASEIGQRLREANTAIRTNNR